jgi:hypothetical protein
MSRGLRNNNPLNIRHSANKWQGARIAQTDKAFVQFTSMAYGYRAVWKILDTYCLTFKRERKAYNVRNIIGRWAPPTENDTDAYVRAVVKLSGLGGNENMPRPKHYRAFWEVDKLVRLIMAMTCVENGIKWEEVDKEAIWQGYDLAFKHSPSHPFSSPCHPELSEGSEDINVGVHRSIHHSVPQDDMDGGFPQDDKIGGHPQDDKNVVWDEYWVWSPKAYGE